MITTFPYYQYQTSAPRSRAALPASRSTMCASTCYGGKTVCNQTACWAARLEKKGAAGARVGQPSATKAPTTKIPTLDVAAIYAKQNEAFFRLHGYVVPKLTAAVQDVAASPSRGHCASIKTALNLLAGSSAGPGALCVDARSLGRVGHQAYMLPVDARGSAFHALPLALLALLEDGGWQLRVSVAVHDEAGTPPRALNALFASWVLPLEFRAPDGGAWRWYIAPEQTARVRDALAAFPFAPSVLIDAGPEVIALWALTEPLRDMTRARTAQRALTERLGADSDARPQPGNRPVLAADDPGVLVPLAGIVRGMGDTLPPLITLPLVEPARVYDLSDLERALAATESPAARKKAKATP